MFFLNSIFSWLVFFQRKIQSFPLKNLAYGLLFLNFSCDRVSSVHPAEIIQKVETDTPDFVFKSKSFEVFYKQFITDSIFQIANVQFPVNGNYADAHTTREWQKETWPFICWDFTEEMKIGDDSVSIVQTDSSFFYGTYCRDCGFLFEMRFDKMDSLWKMTHRQENNF